MSPPETGASMVPIFNLEAYKKILSAKLGVLVVWSIKMEPCFILVRMLLSPKHIYSTSLGYPNIKTTTSEFLAN